MMVGLSVDVTFVRNAIAEWIENHPGSAVDPASLNKETFRQRILSEFNMTIKTYCARLRCMIPGLTFMGGAIDISAFTQLYDMIDLITYRNTPTDGIFHPIQSYGNPDVCYVGRLRYTPGYAASTWMIETRREKYCRAHVAGCGSVKTSEISRDFP